jgi:hypothetical protein
MPNKIVQHGGARAGAGAPPKLATQTKAAVSLAKKLQGAVKLGMSPLADAYPELVVQAIKLAQKGDKEMLKYLLTLLPRTVTLEEDAEETKADKIMSRVLNRVNITVQGDVVQEKKELHNAKG